MEQMEEENPTKLGWMCFRHIGMGKVSRAVFGSPLFMMCGERMKVAIDSQSFFFKILGFI